MILYSWRQQLVLVAIAAVLGSAGSTRGDDWSQWRGSQRDGIWREDGIITSIPEEGLPVRWRVPIGPGYSGPTVADQRVFVTDRQENQERVLCFDSVNGAVLWEFAYACRYRIQYPAGPRAAVLVDDDEAYALGAMGNLHCLDAGSGEVLWARDLNADFDIDMPIWGVSAAPLLFGELLILHIGGDEACIVALDKDSGETAWTALRDRGSYAAPILIEQGGQPVLVCWTGDSISGLNPLTGDVFWRIPFPPSQMPIGIATPITDGRGLFVTSFYDGAMMLDLDPNAPRAEPRWRKVGPNERRTEALHSIISTPIWINDHIYGVDSYGQLRCLRADNGERVWEDQTAVPFARWSTIHFVRRADQVWMFNERGELILGELSPQGFHEVGRAKILEPTTIQLNQRGGVCWSHPAFAERCVFVRNDEELVCVDLAE